jgi:spermidine synthase
MTTTRAIALLLTFFTGFSGLVYEVSWQKYLATLLGSHSEATAAVLGLYLGGLAAGYAIFGWVVRRSMDRAARLGRPSPLLRIYGLAEIGIGLWALAFPYLFGAVQRISFWVPPGHEGASFAFDVFLCMLLLVPPTILMGGTIPILTQALTRGLADATRLHAFVYAFNTAGAFAGSLAAGFVLIHWLGLDGVLFAMGGVNLFAGSVFVVLGLRGGERVEAEELHQRPVGATLARFAPLAGVALLAGFAMMVLQTTFNRVAGLALGSSHFTFAMVVAVFVLCIALGSFGVSALRRIPAWLVAASQWLLVGLLALIYLGVPYSGWATHVLRSFFRDVPQAFYLYQSVVFAVILGILIVPIGLSGALLPLIFHHLRNELGDLGRMAGSLYSWNTVGSLLGALLGGYVLLFWLDLPDVYAIALGALAVGAGILTVRVARAPWLPTAGATVAVLVGILALPDWKPMDYAVGRFRQRRPTDVTFAGPSAFIEGSNQGTQALFHDDDPVNTVIVLSQPAKGAVSIMNNGKSDGSTISDYPTMGLAAILPAMLSDDPSRSFVIGWGTGVTAGELGALDDTKEVVVAEISPGVMEGAPHFRKANLGADVNPKVKSIRRDAYRALLRSEGQFGVIVSEPSNPWVTGVEMLYSREFLEAARSRLTPGGVYAQWFHLYEVDEKTVQIVAHTYASVFENVALWFAQGPDILLMGFNSPDGYPLDLEAMRQRAERPDYRAAFARCGVDSFIEALAHELLPPGLLRAGRVPGELHTLRHPILSQHAASAFFAGRGVDLPTVAGGPDTNGDRPHALLTRLLPPGQPIPEDVAESVTRHLCSLHRLKECATWLARWRSDHPGSEKSRDFQLSKGVARREEMHSEVIDRIEHLFRGELPRTPDAKNPLARATQLTGLFAGHYVHAIPFDRRLLALAWSDCGGNAAMNTSCQHARQRMDDRLDRFEMSQVGIAN